MLLNYVAHRTPESGHYYGWAQLDRQGEVVGAIRDQRAEFTGNWTGSYENSRGGSGNETFAVTENADELKGVWSGVDVSGERLGNAMFFLEGTSGNRRYHVVGYVAEARLVLDYSATNGNEHYWGRSTLGR